MASKKNGGQGSNKTLTKPSSPEPPAVKKSKAKPGTNKSDGTTVGSKGKTPVVASGSSEVAGPKRMSAQQLIGGPSWTGKLPQTLLYEHCVKSGWNKPEYTNVPQHGNKGYLAYVSLGYVNPKTQQTEIMRYRVPHEYPDGTVIGPHYMPTSTEARHFTATYALHRVLSMKNIHMLLPPAYRDYWKLFEEIKRQECQRQHQWMYVADPFLDRREWQASKEAEDAQTEEASKKKANTSSATIQDQKSSWARTPIVNMGTGQRMEVERLARKYHIWNPSGIVMTEGVVRRVILELTSLGFKKRHVEEACEYAKDKEEALGQEWLLIHVPEDDLPAKFLPGNYSTGISLSAMDLPQEYAAKRLSASGYTLDLCREVLAANAGDEARAAEALMQILLYGEQKTETGPLDEPLISFSDSDQWAEEQHTLESIWGNNYIYVSPTQYKVLLEVPLVRVPQRIFLEVRKPTSSSWDMEYPQAIPVFSILCEDDNGHRMPAYIKLSIIKQTAAYAETLSGEQMIFSVVDWLQLHISGIIEAPGRLRDVASAVTGSHEGGAAQDQARQMERAVRRGMRRVKLPINWTPGLESSIRLLAQRRAKSTNVNHRKMIEARKKLPAWNRKEEIVDAVNDRQVVIIGGETGSGKSTQAVQFVLDDLIDQRLGHVANIICTQPRRISALGLADRVSEERCSPVGDEVGYTIRGESRHTPGVTKITFLTTGVLLRRMQMGDGLEDVSHIFVDEVHERSLDTDFILILLKRMLTVRKDLRVVLMSATLDIGVFEDYFGGPTKVRVVDIKGRTFPVEDYYLDDVIIKTGFNGGGRLVPNRVLDDESLKGLDPWVGSVIMNLKDRINYNLIAATVATIDEILGRKDGGVLIFLPGTMEIQRCLDVIKTIPGGINKFHALPLHASLLPSEQRRVFPPAPKGMRKIIVATNVAETSITIEDIVAVIDTGRVKETSYDPTNNIVKLLETWASRAACQQRRGRAGRVRAGSCWKLYTRNAEAKMRERPEPELKRVPLEQTCLAVKAMEGDVREFLAGAISPPDMMAVDGALALLERMGAIADDRLTALGRHLVMIPADLRCSKLIVFGAIFGCLDVAVTIASVLTTRCPFISSVPQREGSKAARESFGEGQGDLLADCRAHQAWFRRRQESNIREVKRWCEENFLQHNVLIDITSNSSQYIDNLKDIGFIPLPYQFSSNHPDDLLFNNNGKNNTLIRALIAAAFSPQIARIWFPGAKYSGSISGAVAVSPEAQTIKHYTRDDERVFIHPSSTLFSARTYTGNSTFLSYFTKLATDKVFLRDVTPINCYSLLFFGGSLEVDTMGRGITVDGWLRLRGWGRIGILVARLRAMLDQLLRQKLDEPGMNLAGNEVVACVRRLVEGDGN